MYPMPSHKRNNNPEKSKTLQGLIVAHAAVNGGMMANFGHNLAELLVDEGAELHFFASSLPVFGWSPAIGDLERLGGHFHGVPLPEYFAPFRELLTIVLMTLTLRRLKVQVLHTRGSVMGLVGRIAAKLARVPVIIHHQDDLYCRDGRLSPQMKRVVAFIEKSLSLLADQSIFVSQAVLEDAVAIGFRKERCVLVGHDLNPVFQKAAKDPQCAKEPAVSRLRELGIPEKARIMGCIGRLVHLKGIDLFLEATKQLAALFPEWVFVIKGDGPLRNSVYETIQKHNLSQRVFLLTDELPSDELPALYRCLDLFVLPSRREGFGMVFAEAMSIGIPVVGPRMAPVTEVVPSDCGVLVEPENVEALVEALKMLMGDEDLRIQIGKQGREHALATWYGRRAAERVVDVYRALLNGKKENM